MSEGDKFSIGLIKPEEQKDLTLEEIALLFNTPFVWRAGEENNEFISLYTGLIGITAGDIKVCATKYNFSKSEPAVFEIEVRAFYGKTPASLGKYKGSENKLREIYEFAERKYNEYAEKNSISREDRMRAISRTRDYLKWFIENKGNR